MSSKGESAAEAATLTSNQPPNKCCPRRFVRAFLIAAVLTVIWTWAPRTWRLGGQSIIFDKPLPEGDVVVTGITNWDDITPSTELIWVPCFRLVGPFLCARLTVPMDYHRPLSESNNKHPKVDLALILLPGQHVQGYPEDASIKPSNFSVSPLLVNPGGPGGSGVLTVLGLGKHLQAVAGLQHDILGFDPRGIGHSTPPADCFLQPPGGTLNAEAGDGDSPMPLENTAYLRRLMWLLGAHDVGIVNSSNVALAKLNARERAMNKLCDVKDSLEGDEDIFRYVGTPNVARDMLSIVHAWDAWQGVPTARNDGAETKESDDGGLDTRGKLVYWGFSYGTLLGATFAAMFPNKVGRVIIDGVLDADQYVEPVWMESLIDADTIWEKFFFYCHHAGEKCAFFRKGDTVNDLKLRYQAIVDRLDAEPMITITRDKLPGLLTSSDLKRIVFASLYSPIGVFPILAQLLVMVERNDLALGAAITIDPKSLCLPEPAFATYPDDGGRGVMCGDKRYPLNDTLDELQARFEEMSSYSTFNDVWMTWLLGCSHWNIPQRDPPPPWGDHHGPKLPSTPLFGGTRLSTQPMLSSPDDYDESEISTLMSSKRKIKTSFPLLLLTNTYDPVTPKAAALKMSQKFEGAGLVEQMSEGHCTLAAVSLCTIKTIRAYLSSGVVPPEPDLRQGRWVTCEANERPWEPVGAGWEDVDDEATVGAWSEDEKEMVWAWKEAQRVFQKMDMMYGVGAAPRGLEWLDW